MIIRTRRVHIKTLIKAIKKNGFKWRGRDNTDSFALDIFCVLEQGAKNLGLGSRAWSIIASELDNLDEEDELGTAIWTYNDNVAVSYEDAAKYAEELLSEYSNKIISIEY